MSSLRFISCCIIMLGLQSCSYLKNRTRDFGDIFSITGGVGVGASIQAGPLIAGLMLEKDILGIYNGSPFYEPLLIEHGDPYNTQVTTPIISYHEFYSKASSDSDVKNRKKDVSAFGPPFYFINGGMAHHDVSRSWVYFTQIDLVVSLGPSVRIGFNPGELVDFIAGVFCLDLVGDDKS